MKILVLDTTHGGAVLAKRYAARGDEVTIVDVYHNAPRDLIMGLRRLGIRTEDAAPAAHFDMVTMPCHCPDEFLGQCTYDERIWFSQSVNELVKDRRFRIEVTGVKGKTSTCYVTAHILSAWGKHVYLHTSRGSGPYGMGRHFVTDLVSIAPPYILEHPKGEYDVVIDEVSLGGSGKADIACITNLVENYGIARNTRKAEEAKSFVLCDKVNVVKESEVPIWEKYGKPLRGYRSRVTPACDPEFAKPLKVSVDYGGEKSQIELDASYLSLQYLDAMDAALEICDAMGVPEDVVLGALRTFKGVPGRGEVSVEGGVRWLRERNPGISHMSVARTLECLRRMNALDNAVLVIDPVSIKVCDKLDKDLIKEVADSYGVEFVLARGDGTEPEIPEGRSTVIRMVKEGYQ